MSYARSLAFDLIFLIIVPFSSNRSKILKAIISIYGVPMMSLALRIISSNPQTYPKG